jgi:hypothetical protein
MVKPGGRTNPTTNAVNSASLDPRDGWPVPGEQTCKGKNPLRGVKFRLEGATGRDFRPAQGDGGQCAAERD